MLRRPNFWTTVLTLLLVGAMLAGGYALARSSPQRLANYLAEELKTLPDENVGDALAQLPALEEPGLALLVQALGHERKSVARGARETLADVLHHWRELPAAEASPHVALLARLLAVHVSELAPAGRRAAAEIAEQLLEWPIDSQSINGTRLIADCETVLRTATETVRVARAEVPVRNHDPRISSPENVPAAASDPLTVAPVEVAATPQAEAASPLQPLPRVPQPPLLKELAPLPAHTDPPREPAEFDPPIAPRIPRPANLLPDGLRKEDAPQSDATNDNAAPTSGGINQAAFLTPATAGLPFSLLTDFAVMQALQAPEPTRAIAAEQELGRRGYSPRNIDLARRATDPDPAVRRELCDALAQAGAEALPWLKQLARDEVASVRFAAIAVLSTNRDPEVGEFLRQLSLQEPEPPVRAALKRSQ